MRMRFSFLRLWMCMVCFLFAFNFAFGQTQPDALKYYRNGRSMDSAGRRDDAQKAYSQAIAICRQELQANPKNMDSYTVYTWSLFRQGRYADTVIICNQALKIANDVRIIETLGEAQFFLGDYKESLRQMEKYIDMAPCGERISIAYFYVGEIYRLTKRFQKSDIAYSAAVHHEPSNPLWWYRLGITRENAGEKKAALEAYQRAVRLKGDYKEAAEGIRRLS
ncbi:tetratricopeptide repeat protein [Treponema phagedenis]|nr:tetratricopeptide repeat protein [Treponema phagedenis]